MRKQCPDLVIVRELYTMILINLCQYGVLAIRFELFKSFLAWLWTSFIEMVEADADVFIFCADQRQPQADRRQRRASSVISPGPAQPKSGSEEMAGNPLIEGATALMQLKEDSGRSSDAAGAELLRGSPNDQAFQLTEDIESMETENIHTREIVPVVELNDEYIQNSANMEQDPGQSSTYQPDPWDRPLPCFGTFLGETSTNNLVDVTNSLSGSNRKAEECIELELTMATRYHGPNFQFSSPSTPEEAALNLGLS